MNIAEIPIFIGQLVFKFPFCFINEKEHIKCLTMKKPVSKSYVYGDMANFIFQTHGDNFNTLKLKKFYTFCLLTNSGIPNILPKDV